MKIYRAEKRRFFLGVLVAILLVFSESPSAFAQTADSKTVEGDSSLSVPTLDSLSFMAIRKQGALVLDARPKSHYEQGFISGSIHIEATPNFLNWFKQIDPQVKDIVFIGAKDKLEPVFAALSELGGYSILGYVNELRWPESDLQHANIIDIDTFKTYLNRGDVQIFDIRTAREFEAGHIEGVQNIPLQQLSSQLDKIDRSKPVVIFCQSGVRAAMGYSVLQQAGFDQILNFSGGMNAWKNQE